MTQTEDRTSLAGVAVRGSLGGVLMGLANLVPGISGGTMLLAAGVYTRFIEAIAEVTTLRFRLRSIVLLVVVAAAALAAIVLLAGPVKELVEKQRWVMYSVFIGLALGGVPIVWRMARPAQPAVADGKAAAWSLLLVAVVGAAALAAIQLAGEEAPDAGGVASAPEPSGVPAWITFGVFLVPTLGGALLIRRAARPPRPAFFWGAAAGYVVMALMALTHPERAGDGQWALLVVAGAAGASAMILPGVSGAYLLLVLGQYETILGAVDRLKGGDVSGTLGVLVPVAVGVAVGVVGVSNLIRWTLRRYEQATLGVLLGLLFGSVLGIYPFQEFAPAARHVAGALGLIAGGYLLTVAIDRVSRAAA